MGSASSGLGLLPGPSNTANIGTWYSVPDDTIEETSDGFFSSVYFWTLPGGSRIKLRPNEVRIANSFAYYWGNFLNFSGRATRSGVTVLATPNTLPGLRAYGLVGAGPVLIGVPDPEPPSIGDIISKAIDNNPISAGASGFGAGLGSVLGLGVLAVVGYFVFVKKGL